MSKIEFKEIEGKLEPIECIDSLIKHLEFIKDDMLDPNYDAKSMLASISIRYGGVKALNSLLADYLKQHDIS